jgi:hypothetical protein
MSKSLSRPNCCSPIQDAIGLFFLRCGQIVDGVVMNNTLPPDELIERTQLLEVFILQVNARIRQVFTDLIACVKNGKGDCCEASANAIGNIGIAFVHFAYQSTLNLGNPTIAIEPARSLAQILDLIFADMNASLALVLKEACPPVKDCQVKECGGCCGNSHRHH